MLISTQTQIGGVSGYGGSGGIVVKGKSSMVELNREISPLGTTSGLFYPFDPTVRRADVSSIDLYLSPPDKWDGGTVKVDLRISSKSLTIRDKRITIKRRISPRPPKQTDEKARSVG
jgi:hypothetical protein